MRIATQNAAVFCLLMASMLPAAHADVNDNGMMFNADIVKASNQMALGLGVLNQ